MSVCIRILGVGGGGGCMHGGCTDAVSAEESLVLVQFVLTVVVHDWQPRW